MKTDTDSYTISGGSPRGIHSLRKLANIIETVSRTGVPDEPFFYLGGPMTGIPQFNFPRFQEVADKLRSHGYNIVSPAELDDPETEKAALNSPDGAPGSGAANGEKWEDFLSRDLVICSLPTCEGGIFMEGWHRSSGANLETYVLGRLKKRLYEYYDSGSGYTLIPMDRDARLAELNEIDDIQKKIAESGKTDPFYDRP